MSKQEKGKRVALKQSVYSEGLASALKNSEYFPLKKIQWIQGSQKKKQQQQCLNLTEISLQKMLQATAIKFFSTNLSQRQILQARIKLFDMLLQLIRVFQSQWLNTESIARDRDINEICSDDVSSSSNMGKINKLQINKINNIENCKLW